MPLRVMGRLMRGDVVALQHGWRQVCSEGGRRGKLARMIRPLVRPMVILARDPSLLMKGWRSLRHHGIRETLHRISHIWVISLTMPCQRLFLWEIKILLS